MTPMLPVTVPTEHRYARPVRYMFWGGLAGMIAAIVLTFVLALFDGNAQGMGVGSCVAYGCVLTLLLSQAVGVTGMLTGAGLGALAGGTLSLLLDGGRNAIR